MAVAVREALLILQEDPERQQPLAKHVAFTRREVVVRGERSPSNSQILPYIVGENARAMTLASALQARGFDIRGMRPPTRRAGTSAVSCCRRASRAGQLMSVAQHFLLRRNHIDLRKTACATRSQTGRLPSQRSAWATAGRDGDSNDWDVPDSVPHLKKHFAAECDRIPFDLQILVETRRLDDWYSEAHLTTRLDSRNGLSSPVPYKPLSNRRFDGGCTYADHRLYRRHDVAAGSGLEGYSGRFTIQRYRNTLPYSNNQMHTASSLQVWLAEDLSVAAFQGRAETDMERREQSSAPLARSQ